MKKAFLNRCCNAWAVVSHADLDARRGIQASCQHGDLPVRFLGADDGLGRIADEVEDDLLKLDGITLDRRKVVPGVECNRNTVRRKLCAGQRQRALQQITHMDGA
jgi:hypothetical protein